MNKEQTLPVPLALKQLILSSNELLRNYQQVLMEQVQNANTEMMTMLNLDPNDGWRLDMESMRYIKVSVETQAGEGQRQ